MKKEKIEIPIRELKRLYFKESLSTSKIANIFKCNAETIRRRLIENDIRRRLYERKFNFKKEELKEFYLKNKLSMLELAKKYGCSQWTLRSNLIREGIKLRGPQIF